MVDWVAHKEYQDYKQCADRFRLTSYTRLGHQVSHTIAILSPYSPLAFNTITVLYRARIDIYDVLILAYEPPVNNYRLCSDKSLDFISSPLLELFPRRRFLRLTRLDFRGVRFRTARPKAPLWLASPSCLRGGVAEMSSVLPGSLLSFLYLYSNS